MASKPNLSLVTIPLLLLTLSSLHSYAAAREIHNKISSSAFDFLEHLEGCQKGDNVKGITDLKKYLERFGYLNYKSQDQHSDDDVFDDLLEEAVKTYQIYFNLKTTGILDGETISKMMMPRCGMPDIIVINDTTPMLSSKKKHHINGGRLHYAFFEGKPKWPPSKYQLTYSFYPGIVDKAKAPVTRAFQKWQANSHFKFSLESKNPQKADLQISFQKGEHGDGVPFDGPGGALAHATAPVGGRLHFDASEPWADGAVPNYVDIETAALHEIGHLLGLVHSSVKGAIMEPSMSYGAKKSLHTDDIQGIKALYNIA